MATEAALPYMQLFGYTAIGAVVSWSKYGREKLRVFFLSKVLDIFFDSDEGKFRAIIELLIFIILGCIVSMSFVSPITSAQAITAGLGWTGLLSTSTLRK
jgi:hypothetical protein